MIRSDSFRLALNALGVDAAELTEVRNLDNRLVCMLDRETGRVVTLRKNCVTVVSPPNTGNVSVVNCKIPNTP
jgi:hypothetical protein